MKKINTKFIFGENRLVFQNALPETPKKEPSMTEKVIDPMRRGGLAVAEDALGEQIDLQKIFGEPAKEQQLIERLTERLSELGQSIDKIGGYFAAIFGKGVERSEIDSAMPDTVANKEAEEQQNPEDKEKVTITLGQKTNPREVTKRNLNRAKSIGNKLRKNKESTNNPKESWIYCVSRASGKWGFSKEALVTFIEMESSWNPNDTPVYTNAEGKKVHADSKRLLSKAEKKERGLTLYSSAHGLAQAMQKSLPKYVAERYDGFKAEREQDNPRGAPLPDKNDPELLYNPEIAIDFMGWHLDEIVEDTNRLIRVRHEFAPEHNLDKNSDIKWLYMAYNNGGLGYLVLRRYMESKPEDKEANKQKLIWFQLRTPDGKLEGENRAAYADRVAQVEAAVESLNITI